MGGLTTKIRPTEREDMPEVGELFEIDALDRDGLMIRSDGTFVRMLEVTPRNPGLLSMEEAQAVSASYAQMLARLRPKQSLQFIVDSRPVHVDRVLAASRKEVERVAGHLLPRQAALGLMWLTLARESAGSDKWVIEMYDSAFKQANDRERQMAVLYLERYMKGRRD